MKGKQSRFAIQEINISVSYFQKDINLVHGIHLTNLLEVIPQRGFQESDFLLQGF